MPSRSKEIYSQKKSTNLLPPPPHPSQTPTPLHTHARTVECNHLKSQKSETKEKLQGKKSPYITSSFTGINPKGIELIHNEKKLNRDFPSSVFERSPIVRIGSM